MYVWDLVAAHDGVGARIVAGQSEHETVALHRDYYSLDSAAERSKREIEDLIFLAATGQIPIYIIANRWSAQKVYEEDGSVDILEAGHSVAYSGPLLPQMPDPEGPNFEDESLKWLRLRDSRDLTVGRTTVYGKYGSHSALYQLFPSGPQPVARFCFEAFRINPAAVTVELDVNRMLELHDDPKQRFFKPDPPVLLINALRDGQLVIMRDDLRALMRRVVDHPLDDRTEPLHSAVAPLQGFNESGELHGNASCDLSPVENGRQTKTAARQGAHERTTRRYARWQQLADELWAKHPDWSKVQIARHVSQHPDLEPWARRSEQTIRNNIRRRQP